jgi:hypothetical protein
MAMNKVFGTAKGSWLGLRAEVDVGRAALRFIQAGIQGASADGVIRAGDCFARTVEGALMDHVLAAPGSDGPTTPEAVAQAQAEALALLLAGYREQAVRHRLSLGVPCLGVLPDTQERAIAAKAGCLPSLPQPQDADPLHKAYAMTKFNAERIEQRLGLLYALNTVLHFTDAGEQVQAQMLQVSEFLWNRHQGQLARRLALGSLIGGEALEENRALAKKMFGPDQSVLSLTQVDALQPHYYASSEEAALHQAIANA